MSFSLKLRPSLAVNAEAFASEARCLSIRRAAPATPLGRSRSAWSVIAARPPPSEHTRRKGSEAHAG
eukprot:CAMPEP_0119385790 /NCGR_PEP_ID=MMETSP1334-20130426/92885_1 /TAXON_ID=127549 /ORGANISM="Calcidiscus leptoporus, Strain RCC1130" /LENGTH=66 /DNA_ID=CAMNT_0007407149 /DNA_START=393 /DNA_END=590 /DNA_ORIENTATION=-